MNDNDNRFVINELPIYSGRFSVQTWNKVYDIASLLSSNRKILSSKENFVSFTEMDEFF